MDQQRPSPLESCAAARKLWLSASRDADLKEVERLYRLALSSKMKKEYPSGEGHDECAPAKKKARIISGLKRSDYKKAGEKLALLMCQSGRAREARKGLSSIGFVCRLSEGVLNYPLERCEGNSIADADAARDAPCKILDNYLSDADIRRLRSVFQSPAASYWKDHQYEIEPPSPYFSFVVPLRDDASRYGFLGGLMRRIQNDKTLRAKFPRLREARFVEMWAHNRPHASGHQLHFDSDDEGRGGVRNPIISTILYITAGSGGPSLVTDQKFGDERLARRGWLSHPKEGRLVAFDAQYLHGVVPGKGVRCGRRVTLMFAFWKDIRVRTGDEPGSARPFPLTDEGKTWARELTKPIEKASNNDSNGKVAVDVDPIEIDVVYETLKGKPWKGKHGMPNYDTVFQGF